MENIVFQKQIDVLKVLLPMRLLTLVFLCENCHRESNMIITLPTDFHRMLLDISTFSITTGNTLTFYASFE